jgi:hypothetical protein
MHSKRSVPRILSYAIMIFALLIIAQLYWYAPWRLDPLAFLIRPVFFLAVPLLLAGFAFALQRTPSGRSIVFAAVLLLIALSGIPFLLSWPSLSTEGGRAASDRALAALEAWYIWVAIPFWFCCFMSIWPLVYRNRRILRYR